MSGVRSSRVKLRGYGNTQKSSYQVGSVTEETAMINKGYGNTSSDLSVGEKTLTQGSSSAPYQLDASRMRVLLVALRGHSDVDLDKLSSTMKSHLHTIRQMYIGIDNEGGRLQLNALIDEIFGDINDLNVIPNTVASFFRGCRMSNCNGISLGCTPHCANALPSDPNLTGFAPCDSAVYILKNGVLELSTHGSNGNSNAYVYVSSNFRGYTATMVRQLAQNGVRHVKTVHLENGKCGQISPDFIDITILGGGNNNGNGASEGWGGQWWWWVILVILAILIIGLIWALVARGRSPKSTMTEQQPAKVLSTNINQPFNKSLFQLGGSVGNAGSMGMSSLPSALPQTVSQNIGSIASLPQTVSQNIGSIASLPQTVSQTISPSLGSAGLSGFGGNSLGSAGLGSVGGSASFSPGFFNSMAGSIGSPVFA